MRRFLVLARLANILKPNCHGGLIYTAHHPVKTSATQLMERTVARYPVI